MKISLKKFQNRIFKNLIKSIFPETVKVLFTYPFFEKVKDLWRPSLTKKVRPLLCKIKNFKYFSMG